MTKAENKQLVRIEAKLNELLRRTPALVQPQVNPYHPPVVAPKKVRKAQ